jgi:hypothetical protein
MHIWPRKFPTGFESAHIYLKELGAVVWYVIAIVNLLGLRKVKLIIITDNSASYFSLMHMYSSNLIACRWLRRLHDFVTRFDIILEFVLVGTLDNPADTPSRGVHACDTDRLNRGLSAVRYHLRGRRFTGPRKRNEQADLRHRTPNVGEEDEWDELFENVVDPAPDFLGNDYLDVDPFDEPLFGAKRSREE